MAWGRWGCACCNLAHSFANNHGSHACAHPSALLSSQATAAFSGQLSPQPFPHLPTKPLTFSKFHRMSSPAANPVWSPGVCCLSQANSGCAPAPLTSTCSNQQRTSAHFSGGQHRLATSGLMGWQHAQADTPQMRQTAEQQQRLASHLAHQWELSAIMAGHKLLNLGMRSGLLLPELQQQDERWGERVGRWAEAAMGRCLAALGLIDCHIGRLQVDTQAPGESACLWPAHRDACTAQHAQRSAHSTPGCMGRR